MLVKLLNQVCAWSLIKQVFSWALKLLKDMNYSLRIQPSGEKTSHRQHHTIQGHPLSLREASEWAQLLKTCLFAPDFKPQGIRLYLSVLTCLYLLQRPLFHNSTNSKKKKKKTIAGLRYRRFPAPEFITLFRKIILNTVLLFLL